MNDQEKASQLLTEATDLLRRASNLLYRISAKPKPADYSKAIARIMELTANEFGVSTASILSSNRSQEVSIARHVAMWLVRNNIGTKSQSLAKAFNRTDHQSALYACKKIQETMTVNRRLSERIHKIQMQLHEETCPAQPPASGGPIAAASLPKLSGGIPALSI